MSSSSGSRVVGSSQPKHTCDLSRKCRISTPRNRQRREKEPVDGDATDCTSIQARSRAIDWKQIRRITLSDRSEEAA
jgi:hypothetical protein